VTIDLDDSDAGTTFVWNAYGEWAVFSWTTDDISIQFVIPVDAITTNGGDEEFVVGYDAGYTPQTTDEYELQQSRVLGGPGRVRRVYVKQGSTLTLVAENGDDVLIQPGFNMQVEPGETETAGRQLTRVALDAVPGAGRGKYLLCPGRNYLYTINGVGPNTQGGANISPEECYWVELPTRRPPTPIVEEHGLTEEAELLPNSLRLHNSCLPCCSCEDYVLAYEHLRAIWNRARAVALLYQQLRTGYYELMAQYEIIMSGAAVLTLDKYDDETLRVIASYPHSTDDSELTFEFTFTLPEGLVLSYYDKSGVFLSPSIGGPFFLDPDNPDSSPEVTVEGEFTAGTRSYWVGLWNIPGISEGDTVEVELLATGGESISSTQEIEF
jgi:hypothetical protein